VKDEGFNLNSITIALNFVMNYEVLGLKENFQGNYFDLVFSKACQYGTLNDKVYKGLKYVSIKIAQRNLQTCIICPKK
jgi:hypothetical protein